METKLQIPVGVFAQQKKHYWFHFDSEYPDSLERRKYVGSQIASSSAFVDFQ
jgi:hypothetical protein